MRNLKRALSLTLASVMLLGMMVVGSSAAVGYDDVSETDNVEAIEVLQSVEVMVGDERGFGPERPVTRAEMAVVMAKLLSLDYNYYTATCPFDDVYDWARGYVGACYANKILSGRSETVYDPGATVTAVEAALMLMRALGYFQYSNDYTDGWDVATVRQGTIIGIFDGVGSSATEPMTRNQVAQMVLNALQSSVVEPDGNTTTFLNPDGSVLATTGKVNYVSVTSAKAFAHAISWTQATSVGSQNDGWIVELGERLYDGKLQLTEDIDVFGRPSRKWEYDGKGIGTYAKKELLDKEYVGEVTGKDLFDQLGSTTLKDYTTYCFIDGVYTDGTGAKNALGNAYFNAIDMNKNKKSSVGATGTGTKTEVYVDHDTDEVFVVVINTYLAIANKDYDAKKEEAAITAYSIKKDTNINEYIKVAKDGTETEAFKLAIEDFPKAADITKDDALLIQVADGEVQNFKPAEVLSAVTISAFKLKDKVVVDGTEYVYTTTAGYKDGDLGNYTTTDLTNLKDRSYNVYLDVYGNLIGVEEVDAPKNYVFITGIDLNGSNRANQVADASAIFLDGTMDSIKINMAKSTLNYDKVDDDRNSILNTWCTYTESNGTYTVKEVQEVTKASEAPGKADNATTLAQYNQTGSRKIDAKNYRLAGGPLAAGTDFSSVYGDKDTVYITAKLGELVKGGNTANTNYGIVKGVVSATVGIENANLTVWDDAKAQQKAEDANVKPGTVGADKVSSGVYTLYKDNGIIIAAVVIGEDAGTAKDLVYVTSSDLELEADNGGSTRASGDGLWTWSRKVVRNGEEVTLYEVGDDHSGPEQLRAMEQYHWYQISSNADGNVIEARPVSTALAAYDAAGEASRYVTDYENINWTVEQTGVDTVVYLTEGGPIKSGNSWNISNGFKAKLEVKGNNTLAVTSEYGSGIHFKEDVNVVLQYWNRDKQMKDVWAGEGVEDLKDMVDIVNENNANRGNSTYYVSALIEGGFATTIVIYDSYNNYTRPGETSKPVGDGSVSLKENDAVLANRVEALSGNTSVSSRGTGNWDFTITAPDWAAKNTTVNVTYDLYVNGVVDTTNKTGSGSLTDGGKVTIRGSDNNFKEDDVISIVITEVEYAAVKVNVVDKTNGGYVILVENASGDVLTASTSGAADIKFTVKAAEYTNASSAKYTVTGLTTNPAEATDVSSQQTVNGQATGDSAVTITVTGLTKTPKTYGVTVDPATLTSAGVALSTFGINGATDKDVKLKVSLNGGTVSGKPEGYGFDTTGVEVALGAAPADVYSYRITIKGMGSVVLDSGYTANAATALDTNTTVITLTDDLKITQDMISVDVVEKKMAIEGATLTGNTMTITFSENVATSVDKTAFTFAVGNDADGNANTNASVVANATVSGKTVTIQFSGDPLVAGNTITVAKTVASTTAGNDLGAKDMIVTLQADGSCAVTVAP